MTKKSRCSECFNLERFCVCANHLFDELTEPFQEILEEHEETLIRERLMDAMDRNVVIVFFPNGDTYEVSPHCNCEVCDEVVHRLGWT